MRFSLSDGKARGVRLANGTEIEADRVVSDAAIWNLYGKLVRPVHIKAKRMKWAQDLVPCHSNLMLYIGADAKAIPDDARPMEIIIEDPDEGRRPRHHRIHPHPHRPDGQPSRYLLPDDHRCYDPGVAPSLGS